MKPDKRCRRFRQILRGNFLKALGVLIVISVLGGMLASFRPAQAHTSPSEHSLMAQDGNTPVPPDDTPTASPESGARVNTEEESTNLQLIFSLTFLLSIIAMLGAGYYIIKRSNHREQVSKSASQPAPTGAPSSEADDSASEEDTADKPNA